MGGRGGQKDLEHSGIETVRINETYFIESQGPWHIPHHYGHVHP
jgi:hypothetical protein